MSTCAQPPAQVVYAIGSTDHSMVKIGTTSNLSKRLASLQTSSPFPLQVIWRHEGGYELERHLHAHLHRYRHRGEWFDFGGADPIAGLAEAVARYYAPAPETWLRFATERHAEGQAETEFLRGELAAMIHQAHLGGMAQKDICEATGYTRQHVRRIVLSQGLDFVPA